MYLIESSLQSQEAWGEAENGNTTWGVYFAHCASLKTNSFYLQVHWIHSGGFEGLGKTEKDGVLR